MMPTMMFDSITLWLIAIAILPWLAPLVKSIEWGGAKIEFHDRLKNLEKENKKMHQEMDHIVLKLERVSKRASTQFVPQPIVGSRPHSSAFVHTATNHNTHDNYTIIDNQLLNKNPKALLFVTQNWSSSIGKTGIYNPQPIGVWYTNEGNWSIFNQDRSIKMPIGAAFNVQVFSER